MKKLLLILLMATSISAADLPPDKIIPRFYELLMQVEKPSEKDESVFFEGAGCRYVATTILTKPEYSKSKTPVWDFLRNNRSFFITKGVTDLGKARIHYSEPYRTTRLWNQITSEDTKVYTMFPTERGVNGESSGLSMVVFTLGKNCLIDIGETFVSASVQLFTDQVYERADVTGSISD